MGNQDYLREKIIHSYPKIAGRQKQIFNLSKGFKPSLKRPMLSIVSQKIRFKIIIIWKNHLKILKNHWKNMNFIKKKKIKQPFKYFSISK